MRNSISRKPSILKMIGSQSSRLKTPADAIKYIFNQSKTESDLCNSHFLIAEHPLTSWNTIPFNQTQTSRLFIHGVLSPAEKDEEKGTNATEDKGFDKKRFQKLAQNLMKALTPYPTLTAIHTKHKGRPHIHFLIHPTNVKSKKKWQQSPQELKVFKSTVNKCLTELGFAPIPVLSPTERKEIKQSINNAILNIKEQSNKNTITKTFINEKDTPIISAENCPSRDNHATYIIPTTDISGLPKLYSNEEKPNDHNAIKVSPPFSGLFKTSLKDVPIDKGKKTQLFQMQINKPQQVYSTVNYITNGILTLSNK